MIYIHQLKTAKRHRLFIHYNFYSLCGGDSQSVVVQSRKSFGKGQNRTKPCLPPRGTERLVSNASQFSAAMFSKLLRALAVSRNGVRSASVGVEVETHNVDEKNVLLNAMPYEELPGPKPLPLLGNTWRFLPLIGQIRLKIFLGKKERAFVYNYAMNGFLKVSFTTCIIHQYADINEISNKSKLQYIERIDNEVVA